MAADAAKFQEVDNQVMSKWDDGKMTRRPIRAMYKLVLPDMEARFEKRRREIGDVTIYGYGENPGNVQRRFHGTRLECDFQGSPCDSSSCSTCQIIKTGVSLEKLGSNTGNRGFFGPGFYTTSMPATAMGYVPASGSRKSLLLFKVAFGVPEIVTQQTSEGKHAQYHSRWAKKSTGVDEIVVFDGDQALPAYVILFQE